MAFYIGSGDTVQTSYIAKALNSKLYAREGVTVNDEVKIPNAETVLYWVRNRGLGNNATSTPGAQQSFHKKGLDKKTVIVDKAEQLSGVIPGVNIATVAADTVNAYVVDGTLEAANRINRDYIDVLVHKVGEDGKKSEALIDKTTVEGTDAYGKILDLRAKFISANADTEQPVSGVATADGEVEGMKKVASYIEPTAMFVSPSIMAELKRLNLIYFKDNEPHGSFLDMTIIECPNLPSTLSVVMLNKVAMISGVAFNAAKTFDGSYLGYADGVAYIGEIAYVNAKTEFDKYTQIVPVMAF